MAAQTPHQFEEYPRAITLPWNLMPHESIEAEEHFQRLQNEHVRLFHASKHTIEVLESDLDDNKGSKLQPYSFRHANELYEHLEHHPTPLIRHVFIDARDSRSPLNCSASMLKCVLACEQVPPGFLRAVYAFGDQDETPTDAGLAGFGFDTHQEEADGSPDGLGSKIRLWYLVRTAEESGRGNGSGTREIWTTRQTAVYHSFDLVTGRSFFLTIRGNRLFREQVETHKSLLTGTFTQSDTPQELVAKGLRMALATHLIYLSWCSRRWDRFIGKVQARVSQLLSPVHTIVPDNELEIVGRDLEARVERGNPGLGRTLSVFGFMNLQFMNSYRTVIQNALLTLQDTSRIIKRMGQYYRDRHTPICESTDVEADISRFLRELNSFFETIEEAHQYLEASLVNLEQGIALHSKAFELRLWYLQTRAAGAQAAGAQAAGAQAAGAQAFRSEIAEQLGRSAGAHGVSGQDGQESDEAGTEPER